MPKTHYRRTAQLNWGLTDEQMKGMHVHHRIPRSKGGTDAPENLYVCSPSFHTEIWHDGDQFTLWAALGGRTANEMHKQNGTWNYDPNFQKRSASIRYTVFRESEVQSKLGKRGAAICKDLGVNACFDKSIHERMKDPVLDAERRQKIREKNSKDWEIISPEGVSYRVRNLSAFCKENGLNAGKMTEVANGKRGHHKGFKCVRL